MRFFLEYQLRQFRQKKDQKGGGKDGQSSSNGIKLEKDVDPGERTKKISEPDPGTLTSAIDSDVSEMDLLDPSSAVHHVDLRGVDSAQVVDQGSQDEGGDAEQAPIELPVVGEGSSSAFEIVHEVGNFSLWLSNHVCLSVYKRGELDGGVVGFDV